MRVLWLAFKWLWLILRTLIFSYSLSLSIFLPLSLYIIPKEHKDISGLEYEILLQLLLFSLAITSFLFLMWILLQIHKERFAKEFLGNFLSFFILSERISRSRAIPILLICPTSIILFISIKQLGIYPLTVVVEAVKSNPYLLTLSVPLTLLFTLISLPLSQLADRLSLLKLRQWFKERRWQISTVVALLPSYFSLTLLLFNLLLTRSAVGDDPLLPWNMATLLLLSPFFTYLLTLLTYWFIWVCRSNYSREYKISLYLLITVVSSLLSVPVLFYNLYLGVTAPANLASDIGREVFVFFRVQPGSGPGPGQITLAVILPILSLSYCFLAKWLKEKQESREVVDKL